ncbi:MAG: hypothetical protein ACI9TH_003586 [Kiritimatiellia bacterium]|jgi:hypothetical protein
MCHTMTRFLLPFLTLSGSLIAQEMKIVIDRDMLAGVAQKNRFENIDDKLFRNLDGTELHIGPGPHREFFVFTGMDQMKTLKAPSTGKAYLNSNNVFTVWYNRLDQGIQFKQGRTLQLDDPIRSHFGVAYGADYFFVYENLNSRVCAVTDPEKTILQFDDFYLYKLIPVADGFFICGFEQGGLSRRRENICLKMTRTGDTYTETLHVVLPPSDTLLDLDPFGKKVLMLNQSQIAAQIAEYDLVAQSRKSLGAVDAFAIYLNKDFKTQRDLLKLR